MHLFLLYHRHRIVSFAPKILNDLSFQSFDFERHLMKVIYVCFH